MQVHLSPKSYPKLVQSNGHRGGANILDWGGLGLEGSDVYYREKILEGQIYNFLNFFMKLYIFIGRFLKN
jgi:hypothetical protein